MKCEACAGCHFVHADLYCNGCTGKPKPTIKTGRAYLFRRDTFAPVCSVDIKAPDGLEFEVSSVELMRIFRIEFVED